jgi:uncharacterized membrane protein YphA (DoxX/SURF4 family)
VATLTVAAPELFAHEALRLLGLAALASPFVASAVVKLRDPAKATAEMARLGLRHPRATAIAVVGLQLVGSALLFVPALDWIGAGLLAGFTAAATLLAHRWWQGDPAQVMPFWEHVALCGGLLLVAVLSARGA